MLAVGTILIFTKPLQHQLHKLFLRRSRRGYGGYSLGKSPHVDWPSPAPTGFATGGICDPVAVAVPKLAAAYARQRYAPR